MTYAIIEASGKQFRVEPGRFYDFDRMAVDEDGNVDINQVLLVSHAGETMVGQPHVDGASVSGTVMRHLRGRKIIVYKMKPKKKTRKKRGHRQELTRLMIDAISLNGEILAGESSATAGSSSSPASVESASSQASVESASSESVSSQQAADESDETTLVASAASVTSLENEPKLPQAEDATIKTTAVVEDEDIPETLAGSSPPVAATQTTEESLVEAIEEPVVVADDSVPAVAAVATEADAVAAGVASEEE